MSVHCFGIPAWTLFASRIICAFLVLREARVATAGVGVLTAGELISRLAFCDECSPIELLPARTNARLALPGGGLTGVLELLEDADLLRHHLTPSPYLHWPDSTRRALGEPQMTMQRQAEWHLPEHLLFARPHSQLWTLRELVRRIAAHSDTNANISYPSSLVYPTPFDGKAMAEWIYSVFQSLRLPHKSSSTLNTILSRALLCGEATELFQSASFLAEMIGPRKNSGQLLALLGETLHQALNELQEQVLQLGPLGECMATVQNLSNSLLRCLVKRQDESKTQWDACLNGEAPPKATQWSQLRLCGTAGTADINATFHESIAHGIADAHVIAARVAGQDVPVLELAIWMYEARAESPNLIIHHWMKTFISLPQGYLTTWECHYLGGDRVRATVLSFTGAIMLIRCQLPAHYQSSRQVLHLDLLARDPVAFQEGWNIRGIRLCFEDTQVHSKIDRHEVEGSKGDRVVICTYPFYNLDSQRLCSVEQWLVHHRSIGISQAFLYDNDGTLEPLARRYEADGFVRYFPAWKARFGNKVGRAFDAGLDGAATEPSSYHHCLYANSGPMGADWLLLLHSFDEYLAPVRHIRELLDPLQSIANITAVVALPWIIFGGHTTTDSNVPIPGRFVYRSESAYDVCHPPLLCVDAKWGARRYQGWLGGTLMNPLLVLGVDAAHWARPRPMGAVIDGAPNHIAIYHYQGLEKDRCTDCDVYDSSMLWASENLKHVC